MYKIMLVDDEITIRSKLPLLIPFSSYGFEVGATARNGEEALQLLPECRPDLILLDVCMPVLDGLGFLEKLRRGPYADTQVIVLSSHCEFSYAQKAIRYGVKAYLTKPIDEEEIAAHLTEIRAILDHKNTGSENAPGANSELLDYVHRHFTEPITLQDVANVFHMNAAYLGRVFQKQVHQGFRQYLTQLRLQHAQKLLRSTDWPVYEVAEKSGFSDSAYFVSRFTETVGMTPGKYRRQQTETPTLPVASSSAAHESADIPSEHSP